MDEKIKSKKIKLINKTLEDFNQRFQPQEILNNFIIFDKNYIPEINVANQE